VQLIVNRPGLAAALALAAKAAPSGTNRPILANILMCADPAGTTEFSPTLTLFATDGTIAIHQTLAGVEVKTGGSILVPAGKFREIVRESCDDETLAMSMVGDRAVIEGQGSRFRLNTTGVDDFPLEPSMGKGGGSIELTLEDALAVINKTRFAAGCIEKTTATDGILFSAEKDKLSLVATDGRRMAISWAAAKTGEKLGDFVVPRETLALVAMIPQADEAKMAVTWSENRVCFESGGIRISSVQIEGVFPAYAAVVPKDFRLKATLNRAEFQHSLKRAALFVSDVTDCVKFEWTKTGVHMESMDPAEGEAGVNHACRVEGGDLAIGFGPAMIREGLEHADADEVVLEMTDPIRPGLLRGKDFLYVAMPMGLSGARIPTPGGK
jgi:DNA polymerase-3 subunit beta